MLLDLLLECKVLDAGIYGLLVVVLHYVHTALVVNYAG